MSSSEFCVWESRNIMKRKYSDKIRLLSKQPISLV